MKHERIEVNDKTAKHDKKERNDKQLVIKLPTFRWTKHSIILNGVVIPQL